VNTTRAEATRPLAALSRTGFRPSSRSRVRIAIGTLLSMVAVGAVLLVFSTADRRVAVLQAVRDLPAGTQVAAADVRSIELSTDPSLAVVPAAQIVSVVGQYTKVRILAGGLLASGLLQPGDLVAPGSAVVAVTIPSGELPSGLRERSQIEVVIPATGDEVQPLPVIGRVVGLPASPDSVTGQMSVSIELAAADALTVAGAEKVRIVLLAPGLDPAGTSP
jgi:hypothetical protein